MIDPVCRMLYIDIYLISNVFVVSIIGSVNWVNRGRKKISSNPANVSDNCLFLPYVYLFFLFFFFRQLSSLIIVHRQ